MGKADLPKRSLFRMATSAELLDAAKLIVGKPLTKPALTQDRHKPGYMAEYMRKRRRAK